ncbi:hypothetical protein OP10G_1181 [Fimbriimonas ginsengisoli Gsoil 348]|uniref:Uncharacterized protein n=1 Tax=Fimbriimonas ginsengisoli Gsoil 348 TaxID=661478 RepID=A0A068NSK0_FIMGI|nr:hypothetical protein OP10G_1181 [Fimbriimonas ginsengisoli Gsoil 348]
MRAGPAFGYTEEGGITMNGLRFICGRESNELLRHHLF